MAKSNKFNFLQNNFAGEPEQEPEQQEQQAPDPVPPQVTQQAPTVQPEQPGQTTKKRRKPMGKRSNPDYEQIGVYVKKATAEQVREKLFFRKDIDFSDLVTDLLDKWLIEQSDNQ